MSNFWTNLGAAIRSEAQKAAAEFKSIWAQLKPAVIATEQELASSAMSAVLAQIPRVATGELKFQGAASQVLSDLGSQGKTAATHLVTAAVQIAYNELQNLRPTSAAPAP